MDSTLTQVLVAGVIELMMFPLLVAALRRIVGKRLDDFDKKREEARVERAESNRKALEQREAESSLILAMSRSMLLNNFERCMEKGYYTVEEREVYHALFVAYEKDGGNSVISDMAPRIRALPFESPKQ